MFEVTINRKPAPLAKPKHEEFDIDFDAPNRSATTRYTAKQVREYWDSLGLKAANMFRGTKAKVEQSVTVRSLLKLASKGEDCPKCKGSERQGHWFFIKKQQWCKCGRCAGKGYITAIDVQRGNKYADRIASGAEMTSSYMSFA